jgi:hypothetical protein
LFTYSPGQSYKNSKFDIYSPERSRKNLQFDYSQLWDRLSEIFKKIFSRYEYFTRASEKKNLFSDLATNMSETEENSQDLTPRFFSTEYTVNF